MGSRAQFNFRKPAGRSGSKVVGKRTRVTGPEENWTDEHRSFFRKINVFQDEITAMEDRAVVIWDEISLIVCDMIDAHITIGRIAQLLQMSTARIQDLRERGNTARALRELETK